MKHAAQRGEWPLVSTLFLDVALEAKNECERSQVQFLAPYVRLRDDEKLTIAVDELLTGKARKGQRQDNGVKE